MIYRLFGSYFVEFSLGSTVQWIKYVREVILWNSLVDLYERGS